MGLDELKGSVGSKVQVSYVFQLVRGHTDSHIYRYTVENKKQPTPASRGFDIQYEEKNVFYNFYLMQCFIFKFPVCHHRNQGFVIAV